MAAVHSAPAACSGRHRRRHLSRGRRDFSHLRRHEPAPADPPLDVLPASPSLRSLLIFDEAERPGGALKVLILEPEVPRAFCALSSVKTFSMTRSSSASSSSPGICPSSLAASTATVDPPHQLAPGHQPSTRTAVVTGRPAGADTAYPVGPVPTNQVPRLRQPPRARSADPGRPAGTRRSRGEGPARRPCPLRRSPYQTIRMVVTAIVAQTPAGTVHALHDFAIRQRPCRTLGSGAML